MNPYNDIIHLPHHTSSKRPRMSLSDRAAQFSPFAALTGYEDAIAETGRLTDNKTELDEYPTAVLDQKYRWLSKLAEQHPQISVTRFVPDARKCGGTYETVSGDLKKINSCTQSIILSDGTVIPFRDIIAVESDVFTEE